MAYFSHVYLLLWTVSISRIVVGEFWIDKKQKHSSCRTKGKWAEISVSLSGTPFTIKPTWQLKIKQRKSTLKSKDLAVVIIKGNWDEWPFIKTRDWKTAYYFMFNMFCFLYDFKGSHLKRTILYQFGEKQK